MIVSLCISVARRLRGTLRRMMATPKTIRYVSRSEAMFSIVNGKPVFRFTNNGRENVEQKDYTPRMNTTTDLMFITRNGNNYVKLLN